MVDMSQLKLTARVRWRWWAKLLIAIAPPVFSLLSHISPRLAVAGLNRTARLLDKRAIVVQFRGPHL